MIAKLNWRMGISSKFNVFFPWIKILKYVYLIMYLYYFNFSLACPIGFTSAAGEPCTPCSRNTFGMKCAEYCNCKLGQR